MSAANALAGLTLGDLDRIERTLGRSWNAIARSQSAAEWRQVLALVLGSDEAAGRVALTELLDFITGGFDGDVPETFVEGMPEEGSRITDQFIVRFGAPPFCWPPDVVRRQTVRDLVLLCAAQGGSDG